MEYMRTVPDKFFDLAVVDPPYGGGSQISQVERERERTARWRRRLG
jgi:DNA modification methylase